MTRPALRGFDEKQRSVTFPRNANLVFTYVIERRTQRKTIGMAAILMQASNNRDSLVVIFFLVASFRVNDCCLPPCKPGYVCCDGELCAFDSCAGQYCVDGSECSSFESCCNYVCTDTMDCSGQSCSDDSDCDGLSCCTGTFRF